MAGGSKKSGGSKGVKIDDRTWRKLKARLDQAVEKKVRVGVLAEKGNTTYVQAGDPITVLEIAAVHEFGSRKADVPERSFIRRTFKQDRSKMVNMARKLAGEIVEDRMSVRRALDVLGLFGVSRIKSAITAGIPPELRPATKKRKKSSKQLIDTSRLLNSITHAVESD